MDPFWQVWSLIYDSINLLRLIYNKEDEMLAGVSHLEFRFPKMFIFTAMFNVLLFRKTLLPSVFTIDALFEFAWTQSSTDFERNVHSPLLWAYLTCFIQASLNYL